MRVEQVGNGEPELAILGAVHGDEPCGADAIETLLDEDLEVNRPVKCIIANERALDHGVRYTESDLNRVFPGDPDADAYETRLAYDLLEELRGCTTLSMHSTQSYERPFALVGKTGSLAMSICPHLAIDAVVKGGGGVFLHALVSHVDGILVECGMQGSRDAAENAVDLAYEFLGATGALPDQQRDPTGAVPMFRINKPIPKEDGETYTVLAENFQRVHEGESFATVNESDRGIVADAPFTPVLMSATGYDAQLGYSADRIGVIES